MPCVSMPSLTVRCWRADPKLLESWTFLYHQPPERRQLTNAQLSRLDAKAIYKRMVCPAGSAS